MKTLGQEVMELRLDFLPVTVNTAVALLEREERPRDVEVNHPVAQVMEVDTLGRDI